MVASSSSTVAVTSPGVKSWRCTIPERERVSAVVGVTGCTAVIAEVGEGEEVARADIVSAAAEVSAFSMDFGVMRWCVRVPVIPPARIV